MNVASTQEAIKVAQAWPFLITGGFLGSGRVDGDFGLKE